MIEVRRIVSAESRLFLKLICDVFDLDISRADSVFYSEPFYDINRKWGVFEDGRMVSGLTTVPLEFGFGHGFGIAGVATHPSARGRGLAQRLVETVCADGVDRGEGFAYLFAQNPTMYERAGFRVLDEVIRGPFEAVTTAEDSDLLSFDEVEKLYGAWASAHPARLVRDERRWKFWKWNLRMCCSVPGGYVCQEGDLVREAVFDHHLVEWPIFERAEWLGLRSLTESLGVPLRSSETELMLMACGTDVVPQMFMTDQF